MGATAHTIVQVELPGASDGGKLIATSLLADGLAWRPDRRLPAGGGRRRTAEDRLGDQGVAGLEIGKFSTHTEDRMSRHRM